MANNRVRAGLFAWMVMAVASSPALIAQSSRIASIRSARETARVTVHADNAPLVTILTAIARQAGLTPLFDEAIIPSVPRVTLHLRDVRVTEAFQQALRGTGLVANVHDKGDVVIAPAGRLAAMSGIIMGQVIDAKTKRPLHGAKIGLDGNDRLAETGDDGRYVLANVGVGGHTVIVKLIGYGKAVRPVTVSEGTTSTVDVALETSATALDQIIVTGTVVATELRAVPNAITVITAKQIEERGITQIQQLFRGEVPGLFSLDIGAKSSSNLGSLTDPSLDDIIMYSRGATSIGGVATNPIKTYVDGVELTSPQYLSQIDPKSIERIEILTGPQASTIYGAGAINGVMQVFTKRGGATKPYVTMNVSEGFAQNNFSSALASSHQYDGSVSGTEGKLSYNLGTSWDYTGAWSPGKQLQRLSVYGGSRYQAGPVSLDFSARQGWTQNKQQGSNMQGRTSMVSVGKYTPDNPSLSSLIVPAKAVLLGRTLGVTMGYVPASWWSHQLNVGSDAANTDKSNFAVGFRFLSDTSMSYSQNLRTRTSQSYSATLRVPITSSAQATLTYGGDHWRNRTSTVSWGKNLNGTLTSASISRPKPETNSGAYVQGQLGVWDQLFFTYGVRADWNPSYGDKTTVRPGRFGAAYSTTVGDLSIKVRGSYGRSIRPPSPGIKDGLPVLSTNGSFDVATLKVFGTPGVALYNTLPTPDLGPEFQQGGEGGLELYFGNRGSFTITRYNQTVDGLIISLYPFDSVRAVAPGFDPNSGHFLCNDPSDVRPDGYCYWPMSKYLNGAGVRNQGWEFQQTLNAGAFSARTTYSWTKSRVLGVTPQYRAFFTSPTFSRGQTFDLLPEHTWATDLSYSRLGTSIMLNIGGVGQTFRDLTSTNLDIETNRSFLRTPAQDSYRFFPQGQSLRMPVPGYTTANMNASHRFSDVVETTLQIVNLTDAYHNDYTALYPTLGRQSRLGVRVRFH